MQNYESGVCPSPTVFLQVVSRSGLDTSKLKAVKPCPQVVVTTVEWGAIAPEQ